MKMDGEVEPVVRNSRSSAAAPFPCLSGAVRPVKVSKALEQPPPQFGSLKV